MESTGASLTLADIRRQPALWKRAVEVADESFPLFDRMVKEAGEIIFMGAGCSYAVALLAQSIYQQYAGRPCRAAQPMDYFQFPKWVASVPARSLFVLFTRSGETTETLEAQRYARKLGAKILCITATEDAPIPQESHEVIALPEALEDALLPTVSTTAMMMVAQQLGFRSSFEEEVRLILMERIHEIGEANIETQIEMGRAAGQDESLKRAVFLGTGPLYPAAYAASLLWQMATGLPAACYPSYEFRHGPMQSCTPDTLVSVMITNGGRKEDIALAREIRQFGKVKLLANMTDPASGMEKAEYKDIVGELVTDYARASLALPVYQSLAVHKALSLGREPDDLSGHPPIVTFDLSQYT